MIKLKYFDTIRMLLRTGKTGDEYVRKTQTIKVVLNKASLEEIPDYQYHVRIEGYTELSETSYNTTKTIPPKQFYVNYENGMIYFNKAEEGKTLVVEYKGRGYIQYPAERIYVHNDEVPLDEQYPYTIDNLQDFLDYIAWKTKEFTKFIEDKKDFIIKFVNDKVTFMLGEIDEFVDYIDDKTYEFIDYVEDYMNLADDKIDEMDKHILANIAQTKACKDQTEECKVETDNAVQATKDCITVTDDTIEVYHQNLDLIDDLAYDVEVAEQQLINLDKDRLNTRLIMKEPVKNFAGIELTYPSPQIGWGVQTIDNGNIYRWNGEHWQFSYNLQATLAPATETMDGTMSKEMVRKLNDIEDNAQINFMGEDAKNVLPDYFRTRTVIFVLPNDLSKDSQDINIQIPFDGVITEINTFAERVSKDNTFIDIEKCNEDGFISNKWTSIFEIDDKIIIPSNSKIATTYTLKNSNITKNEYLRVNVTEVGAGIGNITIQINIKI